MPYVNLKITREGATAAQKALQKRCRLNGLARDGAYARSMESEA